MNKTANEIKNRLSLRKPQAESLEILSEIADVLELKKNINLDEAKGKILAFYKGDLEKKQIVRAIGTKLPGFMIPNVFVQVEEFPLTKNGKIDRKKLEEAYESGNLA